MALAHDHWIDKVGAHVRVLYYESGHHRYQSYLSFTFQKYLPTRFDCFPFSDVHKRPYEPFLLFDKRRTPGDEIEKFLNSRARDDIHDGQIGVELSDDPVAQLYSHKRVESQIRHRILRLYIVW